MKKGLPIGIEDFETIATRNYYYVDKTPFLKTVLTADSYVQLITRPRRFGKSLFMDMMAAFLSVNSENPGDTSRQEKLFAGLKILEDKEFCGRFMGRVPVLCISFKGIDRQEFSKAYQVLANRLVTAAREHAYLLKSSRLDEEDKNLLSQFLSPSFMGDLANEEDALSFVEKMAVFLAKHHGRQAALLVDEYDVPIAKAAAHGYYTEMVEVIRGLLDPLKSGGTEKVSNLPALGKIILTGCLRVSKESIFTGLNNLDVNSVCSEDIGLAECIGFTQRDVDDLLNYYGLSSRKDVVKKWYDGYQLAGREIYCAWDVLNFVSLALRTENPLAYEPQNYWLNTGSNDILHPFVEYLTKTDSDMMQKLVDGEAVEIELNEQVTHADLEARRPEDFWTLLLFSGYLTVMGRRGGRYQVRIPNEEIRDSFRKRVERLFSRENAAFASRGIQFKNAALVGDAEDMSNILFEILADFVSIRDSATRAPAENYYHGMLIGLFACVPRNEIAFFESNREAGEGFADITFTSASMPRTGVVIELKRARTEDELEGIARKALEQIRRMRYAQGFRRKLCSRILGYGIAFHGKACMVLSEELQDSQASSLRANDR